MRKFLKVAVEIAATMRLTSLVAEDEISAPLRYKADVWAMGEEYGSLPERISYLVNCRRCSSIWSAAAVQVLQRFALGRVVVKILAVSQVTISALDLLEFREVTEEGSGDGTTVNIYTVEGEESDGE